MAARVYSSVPHGSGVPESLVTRAARVALESEGVDEAELSITCLPDEPIRSLNRRWLGHDWVPDVLAFSLHEPEGTPIGDVYIGVEQARRQAEEHQVSFEEELARLAIHGTLHILGYEHPDASEDRPNSVLYRSQEALLRLVMSGRGSGAGAAGPDRYSSIERPSSMGREGADP